MAAAASPPLQSLGASWCAHAFAGDTHASLLLPHQVLVAHEDALRHGIGHLAMVQVAAADGDEPLNSSVSTQKTSGGVLLECVADRQTLRTGDDCSVQLNAWVLEHLGLREGASIVLRRLTPKDSEWCQSVELSVVSKYPVTVSYMSNSSTGNRPAAENGEANAAQMQSSAALKCLPESVREGRIDLERVLRRQLCASGYSAPQMKFQRGHLMAVQLLHETYVFRVESAIYTDTAAESAAAGDWMSTVQVHIPGWTGGSTKEGHSTAFTPEQRRETLTETKTLEDRLWCAGFAGYDVFFQDVLLNIALVVKGPPRVLSTSDEHSIAHHQQQQIGSHGLLLSGVHGVGKSLALQVLQREVEVSRILVKRIDGMSLLMESESTRLASTYEFLAQQVRDAFPDFELSDSAASSVSSHRQALRQSCSGVLLIDDIDVLFQTPSGEDASESDAGEALTPLGSSLLRLLDTISDQNARICIVGTTTNADFSIPATAKRAGRFGKTIEMIVPTEAMRSEILARHLSVLPLSEATMAPTITTVSSSLFQEQQTTAIARELSARLAALTGGYVAKDLVRICRKSLVQANKATLRENESSQQTTLSVTWEDLLAAQRLVKPSQLRELNVASPGVAGGKEGDQKGILDSGAFAGYATLRKQLVDFITWKFSPSAAMNVRPVVVI